MIDHLRPAGAPSAAHSVVVDLDHSDDAAVVRPAPDGRLLVLTADVIAPLVDDPRVFGRIAAANAMSDVWAMGGEPRFALNLVFFPDDKLPLEVLYEILDGATACCAEAQVAIVGGHSVRDPELKFGQSITGEVAAERVWSNRAGRAGDTLVLTKALGTGVVAQALKQGLASADEIAAAVGSMTTLNRDAAAVGHRHGVACATDVTGFGLLGHLRNIVRGSGLSAVVELEALPLLPGALEHLRAGHWPGGSRANRKVVASALSWSSGGEVAAEPSATFAESTELELRLALACDAQTSGGLLLCVPAPAAEACVAELRAVGLSAAAVGRLEAPQAELGPGRIALVG